VGGGKNVPATIANPRHGELVTALSEAKGVQTPCDQRLKGVVSAMNGHAWSGTATSDSFFSELKANVKNLHTATQGCVDNVQTALSNCPATVPNPAAKKDT
jgi:hypothetical protein